MAKCELHILRKDKNYLSCTLALTLFTYKGCKCSPKNSMIFFFSLLNSKESRKTKCFVWQSASLSALPFKYLKKPRIHMRSRIFIWLCALLCAFSCSVFAAGYPQTTSKQTQALVSYGACTYKHSRTLNTPGLVNMRSKIFRKWHRNQ